MSSENETIAAASETSEPAAAKPNAAAVAAIDNARASRGASVKRPPRNVAPAAEPVADSPAPAAPEPTAAKDEKPRRKKPSGKKPTRAELAAEVKRLRAQEGRGESTAAPVAQSATAPAAASTASTIIAGHEEAKATFAKGVARFLTAAGRFVARRKGAHWLVKPDEAEAFGDAMADCLEATEEMAPSVTPWIQTAAKLAPFGVLAAVSYEIVDSRIEIDQKIEAGQLEKVPLFDNSPSPRLVKVVDAPR